MVLIRRFEERAEEQYTRDRIGGYLHLNIGEEATVVGLTSALQDEDYVFASYRDHGVALSLGTPVQAVMAELFGKETGVAHGRGLDAPPGRGAALPGRVGASWGPTSPSA